MKTQSLLLALGLTSLQTIPSAQEAADPKPAIAVYSGGLDQFLSDPADEGLLRMLGFLDERIMELTEELGETPPPKPMLDLAMDILRSPHALRLGIGDLSQGFTPDVLWAHLDLKTDDARQASALADRLEELMGMLPFPLQEQPDQPGMKLIDLGNGMGLQLGSRTEADQSGSYIVSWGAPRQGDMALADYGMPAGSRPLFAMGVDLAQLQPAIQVGLGMAGEEAELARPQLERFNVLGEDAWNLTMAIGATKERMHSRTRMGKFAPLATKLGMQVDQKLSARDYAMVPRDANMVSLQVRNFSGFLDQAKLMNVDASGPSVDEMLAMVEGFLGLNLETDLLHTFGNVLGMYTSETTGGGGLASAVFFCSMKDSAKLAESMSFLSDNYLPMAQGRLRFSPWEHKGAECITINFPGWPVPLEISMAFSQGYLLATLSRGALAAALDHSASGTGGILDSEVLRKELFHDPLDAIMFAHSDSKAMAREGYSMISMLYSAMANGVLSPKDEGRELGVVMPAYKDLMAGVHPATMMTWLEGEDLFMESRSSPSITANLAVSAGNPMLKALAPALLLGFGAGWMGQTQRGASQALVAEQMALMRSPERQQVGDDLNMLANAVNLYMADHGQAPPSLEALLETEDGHAYLWTPEVPLDPWGNPYQYQAPDEEYDLELVIYCLGSDGRRGGAGEQGDVDHLMARDGDY